MDHSTQNLRDLAHELAQKHELVFFGISDFEIRRDFERFESWLEEDRHGTMTWLENHREIRGNPELLMPGTTHAMVFGMGYYQGDRWLRGAVGGKPKIAQYARLKDYHKTLRSKLEQVARSLSQSGFLGPEIRCAVDSAPLLERAVASKTGSVFIGKNTCAIHPRKGSFFLLGTILARPLIDVDRARPRPADPSRRAENGGCGICRRCQVHCPTGALDQDYKIDAKRCLSYWTIEHRGEIPMEYWPWISRYVFGCDICQLVCPYNRNLEVNPGIQSLVTGVSDVELIDVTVMTQTQYETWFGGTPMTRAKRDGLRRNAIIALAVKKDSRLIPILPDLLNDESEVVRATALNAQNLFAN